MLGALHALRSTLHAPRPRPRLGAQRQPQRSLKLSTSSGPSLNITTTTTPTTPHPPRSRTRPPPPCPHSKPPLAPATRSLGRTVQDRHVPGPEARPSRRWQQNHTTQTIACAHAARNHHDDRADGRPRCQTASTASTASPIINIISNSPAARRAPRAPRPIPTPSTCPQLSPSSAQGRLQR